MATIAHTPVTELEAVNAILAAVGDAPVNSLSAVYANLDLARQTLHNVNREVQSEGWWFNTDYDVVYTADISGQIVLGTDVLRVQTSRSALGNDHVYRDGKIYDRAARTFTVPTSTLDVVKFLPFEDLPDSAREHIIARAVTRYRDVILDVDRESIAIEQADISKTRERLEVDEVILNKFYLKQACREFQVMGWSFNTIRGKTITPDGSGVITADPTWLRIKPWEWTHRATIRNGIVWNLDSETGVWSQPIKVDVILQLDYQDLPYSARLYVEILSQRFLQPSKARAAGLHVYTAMDEQSAMLAFKSEDLAASRTNRLTSNYTTFSVIDRRI